jgi:hypothetical protein
VFTENIFFVGDIEIQSDEDETKKTIRRSKRKIEKDDKAQMK